MTKPPEKPLPWPGLPGKPIYEHSQEYTRHWYIQGGKAAIIYALDAPTKEAAIKLWNREVRRAWARIEKQRK